MLTTPDCARHKGWSLAYLLVVVVMKWDLRLLSRDTLWIQIFHLENVSRNGSTHPCLDPQRDHPWGGACRDVGSSRRHGAGNKKRQVAMQFWGLRAMQPKNWFPFHPGIHFHPKLNTLIEGGNFFCHIVQGPSFLVRRLKMRAKDLI